MRTGKKIYISTLYNTFRCITRLSPLLMVFFTLISVNLLLADNQREIPIDSLRKEIQRTNNTRNKIDMTVEMGRIYLHAGVYDSAIHVSERSKNMAQSAGYQHGVWKSYENLVNTYRETGVWDKAQKVANTMLHIAKRSRDTYQMAEAYDQLGHLFKSSGDLDQSLQHHLLCLELRQKDGNQIGVGNSSDNIANIHFNKGNYLLSIQYWEQALQAFKNIKDTWAVARTNGNLGLVLSSLSYYDKSLVYYLEAEKEYQSINNVEGVNWIKNRIAHIYRLIGDFSEAKNIYVEILAQNIKDNNALAVADSYSYLGILALLQKEYEQAKEYGEQALSIYLENHITGPSYLSVLINLADVKYYQGEKESAFNDLLSIVELEQMDQSLYNKAHVMNRIGDISLEMGDLIQARKWLSSASRLAMEIGKIDQISNSFRSLATLDSMEGDFQNAFTHYRIHRDYQDSLNRQDTRNLIIRHEIDRQKQVHATTIERQKKLRNQAWFAAGGILLFAIFGAIFLQTRSRHKVTLVRIEQNALKKNEELKSRFLANISHEFRTPLTLINGYLDLLKENNSSDNTQALEEMEVNSQRLLHLVNQLLELSKIENGQYKLHYQPIDVTTLIRTHALAFHSSAKRQAIEIVVQETVSAKQTFENAPFHGSVEVITTVINNLVSNALKNSTTDGKIAIIIDHHSPYLRISVTDSGTGIPEDELPWIFDRFYHRSSQSNWSQSGYGIGLALVKELVEQHHGKIEVESTVGIGSTFHVWLAEGILSEGETTAIRTTTQELPTVVPHTVHTDKQAQPISGQDDKPLILITEDQEDIRRFIRQQLGEDYRYLEASNGQVGMDMAIDYIPDLIISDVMMPEMDGMTLCQTIKQTDATSHIPVILLTALSEQQDKEAGLDMGADAYLNKPFSIKELRIHVRNMIVLTQRLRDKYTAILQPATVHDQQNSNQSNGSKDLPTRDQAFIEKLRTYVQEHIADAECHVDTLADIACLSPSQLTRKLKAIVGQTPAEFLRTIRLNKGFELLKTGYRVNEVAWMVGFENSSYFTKVFKKHFGQTPSQVTDSAATTNQPHIQ